MTPGPVPPGLRVRADSALRREDGGRTVIGGSPLRIMRLTDEGSRRLDRWLAGEAAGTRSVDRELLRRMLDAGLVHPIRGEGSSQLTLTVVVPVRDDADGLENLLSGLGSARPVVVVDDGSTDGDAHRRVAERARAGYSRRPCPSGPASARNHGLGLVETDLVAFIDADVTADTDALDSLLGHFDDPEVVAVAPRVVTQVEGSGLLTSYEVDHSPLDLGPEPSPVGPGHRVSYLPAACLIARTDEVRAVGGFDPELRWGEDVDLVLRLVGEGVTIRYDPTVEVGHRPRAGLREWLEQRRRYGSSAAPLAARHGSAVAPVRCSAWSAGAWVAAVVGRPLTGFGIAAFSTARLARSLATIPQGSRSALRFGARGHLLAGAALTRAATRTWWPLTLALAAARPRLRPMAVAGFLVPPLIEWARGPRSTGPIVTVGLSVADDISYGAGVWEGMWKQRSLAAIRPQLVSGGAAGRASDSPATR